MSPDAIDASARMMSESRYRGKFRGLRREYDCLVVPTQANLSGARNIAQGKLMRFLAVPRPSEGRWRSHKPQMRICGPRLVLAGRRCGTVTGAWYSLAD
jgi:hypothetical protein